MRHPCYDFLQTLGYGVKRMMALLPRRSFLFLAAVPYSLTRSEDEQPPNAGLRTHRRLPAHTRRDFGMVAEGVNHA